MFDIDCVLQGRRIKLRIHPTGLFVPNLMSWFSATQIHVAPHETFCDVGVGCGLHAILAAKLGARRVFGTDISPMALRWARENARRNGVGRICRFFQGSLVSPLIKMRIFVDSIVYNAPQFPGAKVDPLLPSRLRASVNGGPGGGDLNALFLRQAWKVLRPGGRIYNPTVGWAEPAKTQKAITASGYRAHELARIHVPVWGRGNHTRDWFLKHPGSHVFNFADAQGRNSLARINELRLDDNPPATPAKLLNSRVSFREKEER